MGISPLMLAAMNGHTAAVKLLLDMGSDINAQVDQSVTWYTVYSDVFSWRLLETALCAAA